MRNLSLGTKIIESWQYIGYRDFFSTIGDKYIRLNHGFEDTAKTAAHKEVISTGKTDGVAAKRAKQQTAGIGLVAGGLLAPSLAKTKKTRIASSIIGAASGAGLGYTAQNATLKHIAKNKNSKRWQRYNDNMKVAEGGMTEEDFNKKWESTKEFSKVSERTFNGAAYEGLNKEATAFLKRTRSKIASNAAKRRREVSAENIGNIKQRNLEYDKIKSSDLILKQSARRMAEVVNRKIQI